MLMRVSMVVAPCLRFTQAARWKPNPHQNTTGRVSARQTHCQAGNCSAGVMDSTMTGRPSTTAPMRRCLSCVWRSTTGSLVDDGRAWYPVRVTTSMRSSWLTWGGARTCALAVA